MDDFYKVPESSMNDIFCGKTFREWVDFETQMVSKDIPLAVGISEYQPNAFRFQIYWPVYEEETIRTEVSRFLDRDGLIEWINRYGDGKHQ